MNEIFMKYKPLLESIDIPEDKQKEFDSFIEELGTALEQGEPGVDINVMEQEFLEQGEAILAQARKDWQEVAEVAFENAVTEIKSEYAQQMAVAIEELHSELSEKARQDFLESDEYQALEKVKEAVLPYIEGIDQKVLDELNQLKAQNKDLNEIVENTTLKQTIDDLVSGLPEKKGNTVRKFLNECKTEEEVYVEFEKVMKILFDEEVEPEAEPATVTEPENDSEVAEDTPVDEADVVQEGEEPVVVADQQVVVEEAKPTPSIPKGFSELEFNFLKNSKHFAGSFKK